MVLWDSGVDFAQGGGVGKGFFDEAKYRTG